LLLRRGERRPLGRLRAARRAARRAPGADGARVLLHLPPRPLRLGPDRCRNCAHAAVLSPRRRDLQVLLRDLREARQRRRRQGARVLLRPRVHRRGRTDPRVRRRPAHGRGRLHRQEPVAGRLPDPLAPAGGLRRRAAAHGGADALPFAHLHRARDQGGGAGRAGPAPHGCQPGAHQAMGIRHRDRGHGARRRDADRRRAGGAEPRPRLHRPHLLRRRACGPRQHDRNAVCWPDPRGLRVDRADAVRRLVGAGGRVRAAAGGAWHPSPGAVRTMKFWIGVAVTVALAAGLALSGTNEYFFYAGYVVLQFVVLATAWNILGGYAVFFYAGYVVLQFVVLATAWNILGGYAGYVNFGTAAFFGIGAYTAVVLFKAAGAPLGVQILAAACASGLLGFGTGLLTLRLRGIFFSIATVAVIFIM